MSDESWVRARCQTLAKCLAPSDGNGIASAVFSVSKEKPISAMDIQEESAGAKFTCAYCGEENDTFVDPSQGIIQKYIRLPPQPRGCKPNELSVSYDEWKDYMIQASQSQ